MSRISPSVAGKIVSINHKLGEHVQAGEVIATLAGNEFMELQQSFAEAAAAHTKAKVDFERAKSLWAENIGAEKDFLAAKSLYRATLASYQSLRSRITALRLNPSRIENGQMYAAYPVVAPISGYITAIDVVIGQFVDMESNIAEIVDTHRLQLKLQVYETDIRQLNSGQPVHFTTSDSSNQPMLAHLTTIGKTVNPDTKTVECLAVIGSKTAAPLINESFVQAQIEVGSRQGKALPSQAVQTTGNVSHIYIVERRKGTGYLLKKLEVTTGTTEEGKTEIQTALPDKDIVTQGVETLQ
jgi:cobalt-zinc-cadmium efflux system membrane fusion protein